MSCKLRVRSEAGFTLLELLISMTIGLVVLGSIFSSFTTQKKSYELQEQITVMEQNLRVPLDIITRDLRNAGANPNPDTTLVAGTSVGLIPGGTRNINITTNQLRILADLTGNGNTGDSDEDVDYSFTGEDTNGNGILDGGEDTNGDGILDAGDIRRNGNALVSNIISLRFRYYDSTGTEITTLPITGTNLTNIRVVEVTITARTEREDSTFMGGIDIDGNPANGTCRRRTLTAKVRTRNIGLQRTY